jgi:hypothetical protein
MSTQYGNSRAWCFLEDGWDTTRPIEIWHSLGPDQEEVMAHATDRYNAMKIVDALIVAENVKGEVKNQLTKHEVVFLDFVSSNCQEPWSTMASNAILFQDRDQYNTVKQKFGEIY